MGGGCLSISNFQRWSDDSRQNPPRSGPRRSVTTSLLMPTLRERLSLGPHNHAGANRHKLPQCRVAGMGQVFLACLLSGGGWRVCWDLGTSVDGPTIAVDVVVIVIGHLVERDDARVAGTDAGQQRAGGDEVGHAHQGDP